MAADPLPGTATTVNEQFFDAMVRHQIGLLRLTGSIRNKVIELLNASEQDIADKITARLADHKGLDTPADIARLETLLKQVRTLRLRSWDQVTKEWLTQLRDLAKTEPAFVAGIIQTVVPVVLDLTLPPPSQLARIVDAKPFQGKTLAQWAKNIRAADLDRIESQIKIGMVQGESSADIARRVVGTKVLKGKDGITEITRRQAAAITRTAVIAISNNARQEFYGENPDFIKQEIWVSTLDGRTTLICQSLDGNRYNVGEGDQPPIHMNCRSLRVAVLDGDALGNRPARAFTEKTLLREYAQKNDFAPPASRDGLPFGQKRLYDEFKRTRIRELTGTVPAKVTYQDWLGRQSSQFQDDLLGKTRGALFRKGNLTLDKFVERTGSEIPLSQLARMHANAFRAAGLNPEDFFS